MLSARAASPHYGICSCLHLCFIIPGMAVRTLAVHLLDRIRHQAREWRLDIDESFETETSVISYVRRDDQRLVLKLVKQENDEWNAGDVLTAFDGNGVVRVYEHTGGAMLLERLQPGTSLVEMVVNGRDEEGTEILAGVMEKMRANDAPDVVPTNTAWARGFARYLATDDKQIPRDFIESAQRVFADLGRSQSRPRLLHGDLHHYNVLFDSKRGWVAIDPKGVMGELEYEIGAVLRNPVEHPELFLARPVIERRLKQFTNHLGLNYERTLAWAFAQAVLSAVWGVEDGFEVDATNPGLKLAEIIEPMIAS
jgi:streptomycin 6-kinase